MLQDERARQIFRSFFVTHCSSATGTGPRIRELRNSTGSTELFLGMLETKGAGETVDSSGGGLL